MEFKKLVENYTHRIVDEGQNKWDVVETSDLKDICEAYSKELLESLQLSQNFLKTIQPMLADSKDWSGAINAGIKSNQEAINQALNK